MTLEPTMRSSLPLTSGVKPDGVCAATKPARSKLETENSDSMVTMGVLQSKTVSGGEVAGVELRFKQEKRGGRG